MCYETARRVTRSRLSNVKVNNVRMMNEKASIGGGVFFFCYFVQEFRLAGAVMIGFDTSVSSSIR